MRLQTTLLPLAHLVLTFAQVHPANPIQVTSSEYLGNVTSGNTGWGRDLGFQGQIGSCFINTFGDDFKCTSENPQEDCVFVTTSRNSCAQPINATSYHDYFVGAQGAPEPCVKPQGPENVTTPMGVTNVVGIAPGKGIIYTLPGHPAQTKKTGFNGAGYAMINVDDNCNITTVERPERSLWYGNIAGTEVGMQPYNESFFGDHGALVAQDGYLYVYGSVPSASNSVTVARVKPESATELGAYEYYNGTGFQSERIQNPTGSVACMNQSGQGSAFWSPYYSRYVYLSTLYTKVTARTSVNPWGPWSIGKGVWSLKQMPYRFTPAKNNMEEFYSPAFQPKWSNENRSEIVLWVTYAVGRTNVSDHGGHQVGTAVRVMFEGGNASAVSNTTGVTGSGGSNDAVRTFGSWSLFLIPAMTVIMLALFPI